MSTTSDNTIPPVTPPIAPPIIPPIIPSRSVSLCGQMFTGFTSAVVAMYMTHPFDTIKIQYQADQQSRKIGTLVSNIYKYQGLGGFFKGCGTTLPTYPIFWGLFFSIKNQNTKFCQEPILNSILTNLIASSIASVICNPLFVLKTRKQTLVTKDASDTNKLVTISYLQEIKSIYKKDGTRGFCKGLPITLVSNLRLIFQFPLYDWIMAKSSNNIFLASIISKITANTLFYPTNIVGTIQRDSATKLSIKNSIQNLYQTYGLKGFYRGLLIYNISSGGNFTIMMLTKDKLDKLVA